MDQALNPRNRSNNYRQPATSAAPPNAGQYAIEEINAYIAVRNGLLKEAEQTPTEASLDRLTLANNFVATCLRPARHPYILQSIPNIDAVPELKQCHSIEGRIAKLRATLSRAA
jgi:hypothetical protein